MRLNAIRGKPTQSIQAQAKCVSWRSQPVDFAETKLRVRRSLQSLELTIEKSTGPFALRGRGGTGLNKIAVRVKENGIDQTIDQREIAPRHFCIHEIKKLVLLNCSPDAAAGLMTAFRRINRGVTVTRIQ